MVWGIPIALIYLQKRSAVTTFGLVRSLAVKKFATAQAIVVTKFVLEKPLASRLVNFGPSKY